MTTTPTPTGKIKGSFRDVTPKLRNFVGAVKVTTPKGKGGLLMDMGRVVAAYLTQDGVLHRGKTSLDLLDEEPLAEFEILRYDDEQFREARIICDNRGLLLGEEKEVAAGAPAGRIEKAVSPPGPVERKKPKEENLLTSMMKRFAIPKPPAKREITREVPKADSVKTPIPAVSPEAPPAMPPSRALPAPTPPSITAKAVPPGEKKASPSGETDLSAIIKRLRESAKAEKPAAPPERRVEEAPPRPAPLLAEGRIAPATAPTGREERPAGVAETGKGTATTAASVEPNGRVKVDLGQMMKRIKRLDITSIRQELEVGTTGGGPAAKGIPGSPAAVPAAQGTPEAGDSGKSDIDELKAFIKKLEVLEQPKEEPLSEKGLLGRLGVKAPAGEEGPLAARKEVPPPILRKEKPPVEASLEEILPEEPEKPAERPAIEKPSLVRGAPRPAEPERKAKIASLLRRSGLVKPVAEERPREIISGPPPEPVVPKPVAPEPAVRVEKEEAPVPAEEPGLRPPPLQRKKVEITRVPKKPEKPLREPPLIDEKMIQKILKQPGVIAVSTFFEGFAVQSAGRADFEQVAANAEDLFRAGTKIAKEIDIGPLSQIILETGKGKLIIAPHGDLNVCIFTEPDANLGLIRVAIRGMQVERDR